MPQTVLNCLSLQQDGCVDNQVLHLLQTKLHKLKEQWWVFFCRKWIKETAISLMYVFYKHSYTDTNDSLHCQGSWMHMCISANMHEHALERLGTFVVALPCIRQCLLCSGKERASAHAQIHAHTHTHKYSHGFPGLERG